MKLARAMALAGFAIAVVAACSNSSYGTGPGGGPGGHSTTITVSNNQFSPTPDTVAAGQVTFSWSNGATTHNVTWLSGPAGTLPANSTNMSSGTYQATLGAGTYSYHCTIHAGMNGTIVVH